MTMRIQLPKVVFTGEAFDYGVWKQFPFDEPSLSFRLEFTSSTMETGILRGWKVRYNVHEYLGDATERGTLSDIERVKPMMSFKSNADSLPAFDVKLDQLDVELIAERKTQDGCAAPRARRPHARARPAARRAARPHAHPWPSRGPACAG